jgi:hypothetical protein
MGDTVVDDAAIVGLGGRAGGSRAEPDDCLKPIRSPADDQV